MGKLAVEFEEQQRILLGTDKHVQIRRHATNKAQHKYPANSGFVGGKCLRGGSAQGGLCEWIQGEKRC